MFSSKGAFVLSLVFASILLTIDAYTGDTFESIETDLVKKLKLLFPKRPMRGPENPHLMQLRISKGGGEPSYGSVRFMPISNMEKEKRRYKHYIPTTDSKAGRPDLEFNATRKDNDTRKRTVPKYDTQVMCSGYDGRQNDFDESNILTGLESDVYNYD